MFEVLEHTADLGFRAFGRSLEELFENAALALVSLAIEISAVTPRQAYPLAADGADGESLLVNWLSEVLYRLDGDRLALCRFQVDTISEGRVEGRAFGEPRIPERHPARLVVKGVTYHQLRIVQEDVRWAAEVYLDV